MPPRFKIQIVVKVVWSGLTFEARQRWVCAESASDRLSQNYKPILVVYTSAFCEAKDNDITLTDFLQPSSRIVLLNFRGQTLSESETETSHYSNHKLNCTYTSKPYSHSFICTFYCLLTQPWLKNIFLSQGPRVYSLAS